MEEHWLAVMADKLFNDPSATGTQLKAITINGAIQVCRKCIYFRTQNTLIIFYKNSVKITYYIRSCGLMILDFVLKTFRLSLLKIFNVATSVEPKESLDGTIPDRRLPRPAK